MAHAFAAKEGVQFLISLATSVLTLGAIVLLLYFFYNKAVDLFGVSAGNAGNYTLDTPYILGTINSDNKYLYYNVPNGTTYYPNPPDSEVEKRAYDGGTSKVSGTGNFIEYKENSRIFTDAGIPSTNKDNAFGSGVHGSDGVKLIPPPDGYTPDGYIYRNQIGSDYIYRVFKKK